MPWASRTGLKLALQINRVIGERGKLLQKLLRARP